MDRGKPQQRDEQARAGEVRRGMRQAAHVTHTSLPPIAAACGASPELLTFTSAWRASHVAVVILRPAPLYRRRATSTGPMSDVWLLMLRLLVGLNAQLHLVTYLRKQVCRWAMAINEHQNSTFNFAHAAAAATRGTTERVREREVGKQRARHKDIVAASASVKTLPATELCHLPG